MKVLIAIEYDEGVEGDANFKVDWEVEPALPISRAHLRGIILEALDYVTEHVEDEA